MKIKLLIILLLLIPIAYAEDGGQIEPGILPDAILWKGDLFIENFIVWITPGIESKLQIQIENINERNAELKAIGGTISQEMVDKIEFQREKDVAKADKFIEQIQDNEKYKLQLVESRSSYIKQLKEVGKLTPTNIEQKIDKLIDQKQTPVIDLT